MKASLGYTPPASVTGATSLYFDESPPRHRLQVALDAREASLDARALLVDAYRRHRHRVPLGREHESHAAEAARGAQHLEPSFGKRAHRRPLETERSRIEAEHRKLGAGAIDP